MLLKERLESGFPGLQIVGAYTPPFRNLTAEEETEILTQLQETKPHILWVGLSTPKQELFAESIMTIGGLLTGEITGEIATTAQQVAENDTLVTAPVQGG